MSNTRHITPPSSTGPRRKGRHRLPAPIVTQRLAAPGRTGARILAVGAVGAVGSAALALPAASAAPAATRPPAVNGGSVTISQQDGQTAAGFRLNTPFGTTPLLTLPTTTAPAATQLPAPVTVDPSVIASDPFYQGLVKALTPAPATLEFTAPQVPDVTFSPAQPAFGPSQPVPFTNLPAGTPGLLFAPSPAAPSPVAPSPPAPAPALPEVPQPTGSVTGSVSGALGPIGGTLGLTYDNNGNAALTLGYLVGAGGSVRLSASPNPAPTTLSVDAGAQASGNLLGLGVTGGVSGSLTNFNGLQVSGRATSPAGNQFTVTGTVPPSLLQSIGQADSDAAAAEAGLLAAPPPPPPTPNQQVAQDFADLAGDDGAGLTILPGARGLSFGAQTTAGVTVTIPLTRDYLNQVGQALGNAEMILPPLDAPPLTPAQRIDQGFSAVMQPDPATVVQQDFQALGNPASSAPATPPAPPVAAPQSQPDPATVIQQDFQALGDPASSAPASTATPVPVSPAPADPATVPGPQSQADPAPGASPVVTDVPDSTAPSAPVVVATDPTAVSDPAPAVSAPAPVSAGIADIGPVASAGGFSGGASG